MLRDLRHATRQLVRAPGFSAVVILTLGLGIGATTALFTLVDAVLLRPLALPRPDRIVTLWNVPWKGGPRSKVSGPDHRDLAGASRSLARTATYRTGGTEAVAIGAGAENVVAAAVSGDLFELLGVSPRAGRGFSDDEREAGGVAVIGDDLLRRSFGGDAARAIGATLKMVGRPFTIVGVMPPGFGFPDRTEVWIPVDTTFAASSSRGSHNYFVLGRLRDGVSLAQAQAEVDGIAGRLALQYPDTNSHSRMEVIPLHQVMVSEYRATLWLVLGAVGLVLLIACANVANLLLARGARRGHEIAVRATLGAGRARIVRQLLAESLLLAVAGGLAGVLAAHWGTDALVALSPRGMPGLERVAVDGRALLFAATVSLAVCLLIGLLPALQATRLDLRAALQVSGRGIAGGRGRLRGALVITQLAVSLVLLVGAGLLLRSLRQLAAVDPGYRAENLLVLQANYPGVTEEDGRRALAFFAEVARRASALPGVSAVSAVDSLPIGWVNSNGAYWIEGRHDPGRGNPRTNALFRAVGPRYFSLLGVPVRAGREIDPRDTADSPPVAVINQAMARASWPGESPLGHRIRTGWVGSTMARWMTIVGVVDDVRQVSLDRPVGPELYVAAAQHPVTALNLQLVARTSLPPLALADSVRRIAAALDQEVPVKMTTAERIVSATLAPHRFRTLLLSLFAAAALLLAVVGVAGVMACLVAERRAEIGVRIALGADERRILRHFLARALRLALLGLALGIPGALAGARLLQGLLFGVGAADPATLTGVGALLVLAALAAAAWPAWQASRTSPMTILRSE
jgi:putative ABC transport system permease protein